METKPSEMTPVERAMFAHQLAAEFQKVCDHHKFRATVHFVDDQIRQSLTFRAHLAIELDDMGTLDVPKFKHLFSAIRNATIAGHKIMQPHQQRVVTEKTELDERLRKLNDFGRGDIFPTLPPKEQDLLQRQSKAMDAYSVILGERIAAFTQ